MAKKDKPKTIWKRIGDLIKWLAEFEYQFGKDKKVITVMKTIKVLAGTALTAIFVGLITGQVPANVGGIFAALQTWALPLVGGLGGFTMLEKGTKLSVRE